MVQLRNQRGQKVKDRIDFFMVSERERKGERRREYRRERKAKWNMKEEEAKEREHKV